MLKKQSFLDCFFKLQKYMIFLYIAQRFEKHIRKNFSS